MPAFLPHPCLPLTRRPSALRPRFTCSTAPEPGSYELAPGEIAVRFINTPSGNDVVAAANPGDLLLRVSDSVGVNIPRACVSGLCGSCTCDVLDSNAEDGKQTVRACQTKALIPDDGPELVVDLSRSKTMRKRDPMKRFENLDTEYVAGAAPKTKGWTQIVSCTTCSGKGSMECDTCDGVGRDEGYPCAVCAGSGKVRCAFCQGNGTIKRNR